MRSFDQPADVAETRYEKQLLKNAERKKSTKAFEDFQLNCFCKLWIITGFGADMESHGSERCKSEKKYQFTAISNELRRI